MAYASKYSVYFMPETVLIPPTPPFYFYRYLYVPKTNSINIKLEDLSSDGINRIITLAWGERNQISMADNYKVSCTDVGSIILC